MYVWKDPIATRRRVASSFLCLMLSIWVVTVLNRVFFPADERKSSRPTR